MDLRAYYKKVRDAEAAITTPQAVIASLATSDGGRPGVFTEVPKAIAARMIVEGSARLATAGEMKSFRDQHETARKAAEEAATANRLQVVVVPSSLMPSKTSGRSGKEE